MDKKPSYSINFNFTQYESTMRNALFTIVIVLSSLLSGCSSDKSNQIQGSYLTINGITQLLDGQTGVTIYYNGGGFYVDPQTGNNLTVYNMVNILDPDHVYLKNFNNVDFTNTFHLRFVTNTNTISGNHTTINNATQVNPDKVVAAYFTDNNTQPVYAQPNQNISIQNSTNKTVISFTNVTFGSNVISGKVEMNY